MAQSTLDHLDSQRISNIRKFIDENQHGRCIMPVDVQMMRENRVRKLDYASSERVANGII